MKKRHAVGNRPEHATGALPMTDAGAWRLYLLPVRNDVWQPLKLVRSGPPDGGPANYWLEWSVIEERFARTDYASRLPDVLRLAAAAALTKWCKANRPKATAAAALLELKQAEPEERDRKPAGVDREWVDRMRGIDPATAKTPEERNRRLRALGLPVADRAVPAEKKTAADDPAAVGLDALLS